MSRINEITKYDAKEDLQKSVANWQDYLTTALAILCHNKKLLLICICGFPHLQFNGERVE